MQGTDILLLTCGGFLFIFLYFVVIWMIEWKAFQEDYQRLITAGADFGDIYYQWALYLLSPLVIPVAILIDIFILLAQIIYLVISGILYIFGHWFMYSILGYLGYTRYQKMTLLAGWTSFGKRLRRFIKDWVERMDERLEP